MRSNSFKLKEGRFRLEIRKKLFRMKVVKQWNRLSEEVVGAQSLETFKARGSQQPDLVENVPAHCRGLGLDDL